MRSKTTLCIYDTMHLWLYLLKFGKSSSLPSLEKNVIVTAIELFYFFFPFHVRFSNVMAEVILLMLSSCISLISPWNSWEKPCSFNEDLTFYQTASLRYQLNFNQWQLCKRCRSTCVDIANISIIRFTYYWYPEKDSYYPHLLKDC